MTKSNNFQMKVTYIGLGYIGLPAAILTAKSGISTYGVDKDNDKLENILNEFEFKDVSHYDKLIDWNNMKKVYLK